MAVKSTRGEKRRCQSEDCAASFYDLNRDTFACPNCGAAFDMDADRATKEAHLSGGGFANRKKPRQLPITAPEVANSSENDTADDADDATVDDADVVDETAADDSDTDADKIILDNDDDDDALANAVPLSEADDDAR